MSLIAGSALETARTQTVAPPDPPVAVAPSPVPANPSRSRVRPSLEAKLLQSPMASTDRLFRQFFRSPDSGNPYDGFFPDTQLSNCGFGGSRLTDSRLDANRLVLPRKPSAIVIYAGDNDLAGGAPPEKVFKSFQQLFAIFRGYSPSIPIAFVSVKPSPARVMFLDNILNFNRLVEAS